MSLIASLERRLRDGVATLRFASETEGRDLISTDEYNDILAETGAALSAHVTFLADRVERFGFENTHCTFTEIAVERVRGVVQTYLATADISGDEFDGYLQALQGFEQHQNEHAVKSA